MKPAKVIGIIFVVVGLLFAILGTIKYILAMTEKDDRIYTTARIVRIDERETGDLEFPVEHTTYVELEVDGENITAELNTYNSSFKTGKQIEIYYFENNLQLVYEAGSDVFYLIFTLVGLVFATLGVTLEFRKK